MFGALERDVVSVGRIFTCGHFGYYRLVFERKIRGFHHYRSQLVLCASVFAAAVPEEPDEDGPSFIDKRVENSILPGVIWNVSVSDVFTVRPTTYKFC